MSAIEPRKGDGRGSVPRYLVELHHLLAVHLFRLVQGSELDVLRGKGFVGEGSLDGVQIMGANGDQSTLSCEILVELVLEGNEGLVACLGELDVSQNGAREVRSDLRRLMSGVSA